MTKRPFPAFWHSPVDVMGSIDTSGAAEGHFVRHIGLPGHPGGRKKAAMQKRDELKAAKGISEFKISVDIEDADLNIIVC
jgi:hypothetical protein